MKLETLQDVRDGAWQALSPSPLRRYMLGRERCDRLTRLAAVAMESPEFRGVVFDNASGRALRKHACKRVRDVYSEPCSGPFVTFVLTWAIQAIVAHLVRRWWENRR